MVSELSQENSSQQVRHFHNDYSNSMPAGVPYYQLNRLQSVLNTGAQLIVGAKKHNHIKHGLWAPPLASHLSAQAICVCWRTRCRMDWHGTIIHRWSLLTVTIVGSRQRIRSISHGDLVVCSSVTHFGTCTFAVVDLKACNQLPVHIQV